MPIDPKQIENWQSLVQDVRAQQLHLDDQAGQLALACDALIAERAWLIRLLMRLEWVPTEDDPSVRICRVCDGIHPEDYARAWSTWQTAPQPNRRGHTIACHLAAFLHP